MGPFDNERGIHIDVEGYQDGHWYLSEDTNALYIVPIADAEIEGPDDEVLEQLNAVYRDAASFDEVCPQKVAASLGLQVILPAFKRFSESAGYYYA